MAKYRCLVCGYVYNEAAGDNGKGIKPGTMFSELPVEWLCPVCGVGKDFFEAVD